MKGEKNIKKVCFATVLTSTVFLLAQPSFANGNQAFRDFKSVTIGFIHSSSPGSANAPPVQVNHSDLLNRQNAFGNVNLITGK